MNVAFLSLISTRWYYRTLPSVVHEPFAKIENGLLLKDFSKCDPNPNQLRWPPPAIPHNPTDFVQGTCTSRLVRIGLTNFSLPGLITMAGAGSPDMKSGIMIHYYVANRDMVDKAFYNSDGEMLIGAPSSILD